MSLYNPRNFSIEVGLSPGTRLGAYEVVALLGAGGMGEVYRARDTKLGRDVALKIVPESVSADTDRIARFRREAQILAALNHPNIGGIYQFEDAGAYQLLVLELVDGDTLAERIARGPLPVDEAIAIATQIARALEAAHEKGIVHRDLKPANIVADADHHVKVLDFGLAKATERDSSMNSPNSPTITSPAMMTSVGVILGTAAYMAPEQAKGRAADKRSDVWAFGCVLYEMLTGTRAFRGEDVSDTLAAVLRSEPDWNAVPREVPRAIVRLTQRCLEKDRTRRIGDMAAVLYVLTEPEASGETAAIPRGRLRLAFGLLATLAAAGAGTAAGWLLKPATPHPVARFTLALPDGQQFTNPGRRVVAVSPDGTQVAYVANNRIHVRPLASSGSTTVPGTEALGTVTNIEFSPDGHSLVFFTSSDVTLKRIPVSGGTPVTLCRTNNNPYGISWTGDSILFALPEAGVMRVAAAGGTPQTVAAVSRDEIANGPQMLPDGRTLLFAVTKTGGVNRWDDADIVVQRVRSTQRQTIIHGGSDPRYLATGHVMYAVRGTMFAVPFDVRRLQVTGPAVPVIEGVRRGAGITTGPGTAQMTVAANGTFAYIPGPPSNVSSQIELVWFDRSGGVQPLKLPKSSYSYPRISPDGRMLAYNTEESGEVTVWVYELSGSSAPRRLTFGGRNRFPIWSPDSQWLTFQSDRESDLGMFKQRADGSGTAQRITRPERGTEHVPESWSPDGNILSLTVAKGSVNTLAMYLPREERLVPFANMQSPNPFNSEISPDGRWIAYSWRSGGTAAVQVQPFPLTGARYEVSKGDTGHHPLWSRDAKELFYFPASTPLAGVKVTTAPTFSVTDAVIVLSALRPNTTAFTPRNHDIMPDGKRFIAAVDQQAQSPIAPRIEIILNWFEELKARVPSK